MENEGQKSISFSPVFQPWFSIDTNRRMQLFITTLFKYKVYAASRHGFLSLPHSHFRVTKFQGKKKKNGAVDDVLAPGKVQMLIHDDQHFQGLTSPESPWQRAQSCPPTPGSGPGG